MTQNFYITTTLPYVNGEPHLGFATEIIRADILARHFRTRGGKVFFNTGTDEHGQKLFLKAQEQGISVKELVDQGSQRFKDFADTLNISYDAFVRTTNKTHMRAAQKFWEVCDENGYIYKKNYQTKYCIGCELEKQDSDLEEGEQGLQCPIHPHMNIEIIDEENYFFAFSKFEDQLLELYAKDEGLVVPDFRQNEIESFVKGGLQDFSISRLKEKMSWGIPVPGDDEHVMYVWFDALVNYISILGWDIGQSMFDLYWKEGETFQICGKDNLRQQSAMWQAMLIAVGLPHTDKVYINGFINGPDGKKMSKSLGNTVAVDYILDIYGVDALRYFTARHVNNHEDTNFSIEIFHEAYQANLVNGIGNLTNRILQMSSSYGVEPVMRPESQYNNEALDSYDFNGMMNAVFKLVGEMDQFITDEAPFKKVKTDPEAAAQDLQKLLGQLWQVAEMIKPVMPDTYIKMVDALAKNEKPEEPLFPRIEISK